MTCVHMRVSSENESEEMHLVPAAAGDRARVGQGLDRKPNAAAGAQVHAAHVRLEHDGGVWRQAVGSCSVG